jgi:mRNA interferase MazF
MGKFVKFTPGEVVVVPFPFSDLSGVKRRPALVIADWGGRDLMLCQITSRVKNDKFGVMIEPTDFATGHLPVLSVVRPNKIFTADKSVVLYSAGHLQTVKTRQIIGVLRKIIGMPILMS